MLLPLKHHGRFLEAIKDTICIGDILNDQYSTHVCQFAAESMDLVRDQTSVIVWGKTFPTDMDMELMGEVKKQLFQWLAAVAI